MAEVMLGGVPLRANPDEIRWNFKMKVADTKTMGGKVIQILGTTFSDITIRGSFGPGLRSAGDTEGWQNQDRLRKQVETWANRAADQKRATPIRFTYSPRGWDFQVFVRSFSPVSHRVDQINPEWEMALFPVDDGALKIIDGVKDLYIQRLMDGVGWKQSDYNGPTQEEVDATLSPFSGSVPDYYRDKFTSSFTGEAGAAGTTDDGTGTDPGSGGNQQGPVPQ